MLGWSQRCFYTCKLVVSSLRKSWPRPSQPKSKSQWGVVRFTSCFTHLITSTWMGHSNLLGRKSLPGSISITNFLAHHTMDTVSIRFVQPCGFGLEYNDTCAMVKSSILVQLQNSCGLVVPKFHSSRNSFIASWLELGGIIRDKQNKNSCCGTQVSFGCHGGAILWNVPHPALDSTWAYIQTDHWLWRNAAQVLSNVALN